MTTPFPRQVGRYVVEREIGRGGMGVVWLGRDSDLGRPVALKALPDDVATDPERLARFEREARVLASLSHPNIAVVFGVEQAEGRRLLVMEYVEGESLAHRLDRGAMGVDEALQTCVQIAGALEHAHEQGVVHRDLKPGNVQLTPAGGVKVLDFGLARAGAGGSASGAPSHSPTLSLAATAQGIILGTAAYMSPEQARGRAVDRRADIWSFGCVLYECLTGARVFDGETTSDSIAAVLERQPDWSRLPTRTPARVRELLTRCLEKDAKQRLRDIGDARIEIERALAGREWSGLTAHAGVDARRAGVGKGAAAGLVLAACVAGAGGGIAVDRALHARGSRGAAAPPLVGHVAVTAPEGMQILGYDFSSDGRMVVARLRSVSRMGDEDEDGTIWVRTLESDGWREVKGSDRSRGFDLSPDGRWLVFARTTEEGSSRIRLHRAPTDGSAPAVEVGELPSGASVRGIECLANGEVVALTFPPLRLVRFRADSAQGVESVEIKGLASGQLLNRLTSVGDGARLLTNCETYRDRRYVVGTGVIDLETGEFTSILDDGGAAVRLESLGQLVFTRGDTILCAPIDPVTLRLTGPARSIGGGLRTFATWVPAGFGLSESGDLLYKPGGRIGGGRRIVALDRAGGVTEWCAGGPNIEGSNLDVSADGTEVAAGVLNADGLYEVWLFEPGAGAGRRIASDPRSDLMGPQLSADGGLLAYARGGGQAETDGVYVQRIGGGPARKVLPIPKLGDEWAQPLDFLPNGAGLLCVRLVGGSAALVFIPLSDSLEGGTPVELFNLGSGDDRISLGVSPDGGMIAYSSWEGGRSGVYVRSIDEKGRVGEAVLVGERSSDRIAWTGRVVEGRSELYVGAGVRGFLTTVKGGARPHAEPLVAVHDFGAVRPRLDGPLPLPNGRLIAVQRGADEEEPSHLVLVQNWVEAVRRRMGEASGRK